MLERRFFKRAAARPWRLRSGPVFPATLALIAAPSLDRRADARAAGVVAAKAVRPIVIRPVDGAIHSQ
jgi:hypothetical protein